MYKKKDEGTVRPHPAGEERKGPPRRRIPPPPRAPREHTVVTSKTVVPPMPEKHELLPKPNWEQNYAPEFQNYRKEIEKVKEEKVVHVAEP